LPKKGPISHEAEKAKREFKHEYFDIMNLHALSMLLLEKTGEYLETLEQKETDGFKVRDLRLQIEIIHEVIELRRSEKLRNSLLFRHLFTHQEN